MSKTFEYYTKEYQRVTGKSWHRNPQGFRKFQVEQLEKEITNSEEVLLEALEEIERNKHKLLHTLARIKNLVTTK